MKLYLLWAFLFASTQAAPIWVSKDSLSKMKTIPKYPKFQDDIVNAVTGFAKKITTGSENDLDTPQYRRVQIFNENQDDEFEEREYEGDKYWACYKRVISPAQGDNGMFMKLFRYIQGNNADEVKIEMTKPVSTKWTPMNEAMKTIEKEMCFYLNEEFQVNPPQPTDPDVYLVQRPAMTVYTRVQGGWMDDKDWKKESRVLDQLLDENGLQVESSYFYVNGYNSPWDPIGRRNEVWKVKKNLK